MAAAAAVVPLAPPNTTQANHPAPSNPVSSNNYLGRCVVELKPETISDHSSNASLFRGLSIATLVFFAIFAVGAFVTVGILAAPYLPLAAIGALCLTPKALELHKALRSSSNEMRAEADRLNEISQRFNALPTEPRDIALKLHAMAIYWGGIPGARLDNLAQLKPLIARHDYYVDKQRLCENHATQLRAAMDQLVAQARSADTEEKRAELEDGENGIKAHRLAILEDEKNALRSKIQAAFVHAVIERPNFAGNFETLAQITDTSLADRAVAREFNDAATANNFVQFKQPNVQALTLNDMKTQPITVLAHRFIQAMPAA